MLFLGYKKYGFSSFATPSLGISVWCVERYDKYLSKIDTFQEIAVRFGFLKEATPILSLLGALDNLLWKSGRQKIQILLKAGFGRSPPT